MTTGESLNSLIKSIIMMKKQTNILTTGTLFWVKAGGRGCVPIPLELLSTEQIQNLRLGLENNQYPLDVPSHTLNSRYIWINEYGLPDVQVTNIELSPQIKRKLRLPKKSVENKTYRFTLSDMVRLMEEFKSGMIDIEFVQSILSQPWEPWNYSEWMSLRDSKIKNFCETCGKTSNLVLQHIVQPRKINTIIYDLVREEYEAFQSYIEQHITEVKLPLPNDIKKVPVCPKCGSSRVRYRMRKKNYVCEKTRNTMVCKHEFTAPNFGYDERDIIVAEKKRRSILKEMFCHECNIYHRATEIALEEIITYLKMVNTKTLCNKCAFIEDRPWGKA